jgi:hypothetical protein
MRMMRIPGPVSRKMRLRLFALALNFFHPAITLNILL